MAVRPPPCSGFALAAARRLVWRSASADRRRCRRRRLCRSRARTVAARPADPPPFPAPTRPSASALQEKAPKGNKIGKAVTVVDGRGHLSGRLASVLAKELLHGGHIVVVRCEELVISGSIHRNKQKWSEAANKKSNTNPTRGGSWTYVSLLGLLLERLLLLLLLGGDGPLRPRAPRAPPARGAAPPHTPTSRRALPPSLQRAPSKIFWKTLRGASSACAALPPAPPPPPLSLPPRRRPPHNRCPPLQACCRTRRSAAPRRWAG